MNRAIRIIGRCILSILLLFLTLCTVGEIRHRILVNHASDLLSDIHSLHLHRSNWKDAQRLMARWGRWGHYDGACTSEDCMYVITLRHPAFNLHKNVILRTIDMVSFFRLLPRQWGSGGLHEMKAMFLVQNGVVVRSGTQIMMGAGCCGGTELIVSVLSRPSLGTPEFGQEAQRSHHPDYSTWSPGGCSFCIMKRVTYADSMPPQEVARLSDFQLSCATRWNPCLTLEELAPAVRPLRQENPPINAISQLIPSGCTLPLYTLGRDAHRIISAEALEDGASLANPDGLEAESSRVRVLAAFKADFPWPIHSIQKVITFEDASAGRRRRPAHLVKNRYYLLIPGEHSERDRIVPVGCGVIEGSPTTDQEIRRGMAMEDQLKGFEPTVSLNGFAREPPVPYGAF
jgi:hypothetical protein